MSAKTWTLNCFKIEIDPHEWNQPWKQESCDGMCAPGQLLFQASVDSVYCSDIWSSTPIPRNPVYDDGTFPEFQNVFVEYVYGSQGHYEFVLTRPNTDVVLYNAQAFSVGAWDQEWNLLDVVGCHDCSNLQFDYDPAWHGVVVVVRLQGDDDTAVLNGAAMRNL